MANPAIFPVDLPPEVAPLLERLCSQLAEALKENLVSVVLYGGLARGEFNAKSSDLNLLLVAREIGTTQLDAMELPLREARRERLLNLMVLTVEDLEDSAEVFSGKFLDIQRNHRVLCGEEVIRGLVIPRERLKRQCLRELMNLQLRLRAAFLQAGQRPEAIEGTLQRSVSTLLGNLRVLAELKTGQPVGTNAGIIGQAASLGLDGAVLKDLLALRRRELKPETAALIKLYDAMMQQVDRARHEVEKL